MARSLGGYIIIARKLLDSDLMDMPPLYLKLWVWMLAQANWRDRDKLKRGQFVTSIAKMQEAMSHHVGYRKETPTRDSIRSAYEAFTKATMITTTKTTRGMIITILNYELYQNPKNYEAHSESHDESTAKPTITPHGTEEYEQKKKETLSVEESRLAVELDEFFELLWAVYPRKDGKKAARRHYAASVKTDADMDMINCALGNYLDSVEGKDPQYVKNGSTFFNNWRDWIPKEGA